MIFPCLRAYHVSKLDCKYTSCIFINYLAHHDEYLCLDPSSRKVFIFRDVKFIEHDFSLNNKLSEGHDDIISKFPFQYSDWI